ncbi:hypothetical protein jhhlp_003186 [Lomentospora prolificans]|uniref:Uncharacterized protein n=1 Tax=Lomentospora prolificans TaxID=41688 RepID=A0A2N3NG61_9PEZI|nr:hypothetical protein jhhlp_003186 [Lomentospora prolificans]
MASSSTSVTSDLLGLVTRERCTKERNDSGIEVRLPLLSVEVFLALVTRAEVEQHGTDLLALSLLHGAILDKSAEGGKTGTETSHDERSSVLGGELHNRRLDGYGNLGTWPETVEVASRLAKTPAALRIDPIDDDNHESHAIGSDSLGRSDGVLTPLKRSDNANEIMEARMGRLELLEDVDIRDGVSLGSPLELLGALLATKSGELGLLFLVGGELGESLVEALGHLSKDVDVLNKRLVHGTRVVDGGVLAARHLDKLIRVETIEVDKVLNVLLVILGVDTESLSDLVRDTRIAEIELNVENVAVIGAGGKTTVLLDSDGGSLYREVGAEGYLRAISLLESQALGGSLPIAQGGLLNGLLLLEADEAVRLSGLQKAGLNSVLGDLSPGLGHLDLTETSIDYANPVLERGLATLSKDELADLLGRDVRTSNLDKGKLEKEPAANGITLKLGSKSGIKGVNINVLVVDILAEMNGESLLNILLLEVRKLDDDVGVLLDALGDGKILQKLLVTNDGDIGLANLVGRFDGLLGAANIGTDNAALHKTVVGLVEVDVVSRLAGEEVCEDSRSANDGGIIKIPESVLVSLDLRNDIILYGDIGVLAHDLSEEGRDIVHGGFGGDLAQHNNVLGRLGENLEELLLDEGSVDTDLDDANLGTARSELVDNLGSQLRLGASEDDKDLLSILVAGVLEEVIGRSKLIVELSEELNNFSGDVKPLVQRGNLFGDLGEDIGNAAFTQGIDNTKSLAGHANTVVDVEGGDKARHQGRKDGHVLRLIGREAGDKTKTKVLGDPESAIVLSNEAIAAGVVGSGNMGDNGARDSVKERELVESATKVTEAAGGDEKSLRDMALAQFKVGRKDVAESKSTGTGPGLEGKDSGGVAMDVLLLLRRPVLGGDIKIKGLGRIRKDLVGELVSDLLDEQLSCHIARARDVREGHALAEGESRGDGAEGGSIGAGLDAAGSFLKLEMHRSAALSNFIYERNW